MKKLLALLALAFSLVAVPALASNCASYPYTLTNGQTADANQVMANFNSILGCGNNNLAKNGANSDITSLSGLTTPLSVAQGGQGSASLTAHGVVVGEGTSAVAVTSAGTSGQVLTSNGASADPTFQAAAGGTVTSVATNNGLTGGTITSTGTIGLATITANTFLANVTGSTAVPTATSLPSCSSTGNALLYTSGTGLSCATGYAPLASPTFTGTPAAPTAAGGTSTTQLATTAFVATSFAPLASPTFTGTPAAPTPGSNINTTQIPTTAWVNTYYAPLASPTFTGTPAAPTASGGTNTTQLATTAFVATSFAPLASPTFTGTPAAPTATAGTNTTQLATTAFVATSFAPKASPVFTGSTPTSNGTALVLTTDARFGGPAQLSKSAAYAFALTDAGGEVYHPSADTTARTWTIPANASVAFPVVSKIEIVNDCSAGVLTIAITSDTLEWFPAGTTGSRTIAACGIATLTKVTSTEWVITGAGIT